MKVRSNTPDRLVLERAPWLLGLMLIAFVLIFVGVGLAMTLSGELMGLFILLFGGGIGAAAFLAFVRKTQVIFDTTAASVTHRVQTMFGFTETVIPLAAVDEASIQTSRGDQTDMHRPVLMMAEAHPERVVPLVTVYVSGRSAFKTRDVVNAWLADLGDTDKGA